MTESRPRRTRPLTARVAPRAAEIQVEAPPEEPGEEQWSAPPAGAVSPPALQGPDPAGSDNGAAGYDRLRDDVRRLRVGGAALSLDERSLMILGGVLAAIGLAAILVGWYGAAHSPFLFQQVPYLISGGLLGVALVFLGSILYFAHWLTELVKEGRAQSTALIAAIGRLENTVKQQAIHERFNGNGGEARDLLGRAQEPATGPLVATVKGTMAHRPDCIVVAGKRDLRAVAATDGLEPCRLCDPYAEVSPQ